MTATSPPIQHYENFPVASLLCPPRLRQPITAIYHFARAADDLADEGTQSAEQRLAALAQYRLDLWACAGGGTVSERWRSIFEPLGVAIGQFELPVQLLDDLLNAFCQDVTHTRDGLAYSDAAALLDYCSRSANPVGRLLLHMYGMRDAHLLHLSDQICSALQLINFWQDLGGDIARGRYYFCEADLRRFGVQTADILARRQSPHATLWIAHCVGSARALMCSGSALAKQIPGRAGWELRLVVQGGLRILDKIENGGYRTLQTRPKITVWDLPWMLWRALWM